MTALEKAFHRGVLELSREGKKSMRGKKILVLSRKRF